MDRVSLASGLAVTAREVSRSAVSEDRALVLSRAEAETLATLCFASVADAGIMEVGLFDKLGRFLRSFQD